MKTFLFFIISIFYFHHAVSQNCMNFLDNISWDSVKTIARENNSFICVYAYTWWCSESCCQYMDSVVFKDTNVCNFYSENFINCKLDIEEPEGILFDKEFPVYSYPEFLYFDSLGQLLLEYAGKKNSQGFIDLGKYVLQLTSVPEIDISTDKLFIYPNPTSNSLTVQFETSANSNSQFTIFDFTGKEIIIIQKNYLPKGKHLEQINTEQLTPGIYLLIANICTDAMPCVSQTMKIIKIQ